MFGLPGSQELLIIIGIVVFLSLTGLWTPVIRGIRELRGERVDSEPRSRKAQAPANNSNLDMCYRVLGLKPSAAWEEIERAYRQKAKQHHPDLGGDEDMMRALNEAYSMLKKVRRG
jgi:hypothetical protein